MKKALALCFALFITGWQSIFAQAPKFDLATPAGWTREDTVRQSTGNMLIKLVSPPGMPSKGFKEIIQLLIQKNSPDLEALKNKLKDGADFFKEDGSGQLTIDNTNTDWFEIAIRRKNSPQTFTERYYHLAKNDLSYTFICIIPGEDFSPIQPQVDAVLKSFKVLE